MMRASSLWLGLCMAGFAALSLPGGPAQAQPMLYEQRLPEGFAFVRFANTLPGAVTVKPDFGDPLALKAEGAGRVTDYMVAEDVAKRPVKISLTDARGSAEVTVTIPGGGYNTVLLQRQGEALRAVVINDKTEFNQVRARLAFYNAVPDCAGGALALDPSGQSVFSQVAPGAATARSTNPASARVVASCGGRKAAALDLGRLEAGGQYSVWLMAPDGNLTSFMVRDRIAPR
ncbi:ABC transporter permease [Roseomonas sp. GC11]|uniref:ABC transporter permease n=1 Tax=Roseomonas sp. GC11 TaxID=2950546 RepID=UPI00210EC2A5|nr:ABC transporter permease [Roseomonas sp. GC11]MCQ4159162.1 ABC transporter permease [Roseomonas sp. GC11]